MTREENARAAVVAICTYLSTSPTYGDNIEMWQHDLGEALKDLGLPPKALGGVVDAAIDVASASGPRLRRQALVRLRWALGAYFEGEAVRRMAALKDLRGAA